MTERVNPDTWFAGQASISPQQVLETRLLDDGRKSWQDWHRMFEYNELNGALIWKERPCDEFPSEQQYRAWNTRHCGKMAGSLEYEEDGTRKAIRVLIKGQKHRAHRIVWEMHNGAVPMDKNVVHVNCNPFDNRIENLTLVLRTKKLPKPGKVRTYEGVCSLQNYSTRPNNG